MLEADTLERIVQLDIDAKVIGIELELVAFPQRALFIDIHQKSRYRTVAGQLPMPIAVRMSLENDPLPGGLSLHIHSGMRHDNSSCKFIKERPQPAATLTSWIRRSGPKYPGSGPLSHTAA